MFRGVLASRASDGQRGGSAQGLNRMEAGMVGDQMLCRATQATLRRIDYPREESEDESSDPTEQ
jgi:hypothetical protein